MKILQKCYNKNNNFSQFLSAKNVLFPIKKGPRYRPLCSYFTAIIFIFLVIRISIGVCSTTINFGFFVFLFICVVSFLVKIVRFCFTLHL